MHEQAHWFSNQELAQCERFIEKKLEQIEQAIARPEPSVVVIHSSTGNKMPAFEPASWSYYPWDLVARLPAFRFFPEPAEFRLTEQASGLLEDLISGFEGGLRFWEHGSFVIPNPIERYAEAHHASKCRYAAPVFYHRLYRIDHKRNNEVVARIDFVTIHLSEDDLWEIQREAEDFFLL